MLVWASEYGFNCCFFAVVIYAALSLLEGSGKKRPGTRRDRAVLALVMAVSTTVVQLLAHGMAIVYLAFGAGNR